MPTSFSQLLPRLAGVLRRPGDDFLDSLISRLGESVELRAARVCGAKRVFYLFETEPGGPRRKQEDALDRDGCMSRRIESRVPEVHHPTVDGRNHRPICQVVSQLVFRTAEHAAHLAKTCAVVSDH